jgi:hypothetical protein
VSSTLTLGTGAERACCLTRPVAVSVLTDDIRIVNAAASPTPLHLKTRDRTCRAREPIQTMNAARATNKIRLIIFGIFVLNELSVNATDPAHRQSSLAVIS